ncbi:MAG TPA: GDYXXLXY domain-containing protein [Xanthobacteraceae bacterium]|nr:GDYXXLXY domain-containing protein [Xanthobacteraceae bacterium]
MTKIAAYIARVPRLWLYASAGLLQLALIGLMVGDRIRILRSGSEVMLQTRPIDPRDFLRGDYVTLGYDISTIPAGELKDQPVSGESAFVYVKLAPKPDGFYQAVSVHREPVPLAAGEVLIRGRAGRGSMCGNTSGQQIFCDTLRLDYGIESFFVPQGEGRAIESARNAGKVAIVAAVTPGGRAAIKRLLLDGKPVYDEPMF